MKKFVLFLLLFAIGIPQFFAQEESVLQEHNMELVKEFNSHYPVYIGNDQNKKWSALVWIFGLKEGSIIETDELKVNFEMRKHVRYYSDWGKLKGENFLLLSDSYRNAAEDYRFCILTRLTNKTNRTIFVDLGTSYIIKNDIAQTYYTPSATSTTSTISSGASLNVGAITNALGINGPIGAIANGIGVNNGSATSNTQVTFSQRIVSIPPQSTILLSPQSIEEGCHFTPYKGQRFVSEMLLPYASYFVSQGFAKEKKKYYQCKFSDLKRGQQIDFPDINIYPLSLAYTYSFDEKFQESKMMQMSFRIKAVMGADWDGGRIAETKKLDYRGCPLIFFTMGAIYKEQ